MKQYLFPGTIRLTIESPPLNHVLSKLLDKAITALLE